MPDRVRRTGDRHATEQGILIIGGEIRALAGPSTQLRRLSHQLGPPTPPCKRLARQIYGLPSALELGPSRGHPDNLRLGTKYRNLSRGYQPILSGPDRLANVVFGCHTKLRISPRTALGRCVLARSMSMQRRSTCALPAAASAPDLKRRSV
jgi:hypothetical protein